MQFIFCADPFDIRQPDCDYVTECEAVKSLGFQPALIDFEALVNEQNPGKAVRKVPVQPTEQMGLYRGWMLTPTQYQQLFEALAQRGVRLLNDATAYKHCHYLPESYSIIAPCTPKSVWLTLNGELDMDIVMSLLRDFGDRPLILKDFVKSRKHEWHEACYIPQASDKTVVERVVRRFLQLQETGLNEGLVFREFVDFEPLTTHSKSGMPLTQEFRLFFLDAEPVYVNKYWDEGNYAEICPPMTQFCEVAQAVQSRFFTMDVAKRLNGDWMIVELGDGQVAGLPDSADIAAFYQALSAFLT
ncbi:MAG: ATP-grasp domain-containing protein [Trichocoleus desertorum ATA4-8-CV12]|jgi:hypothetical protein|nr:ATP-grasp domain-containing protein [Trichocoleus desertorum ATA4-8-CV12]